MADSGKDTPRQRMIGIMYLVLTAMLALQVKNTVLDKFIDIDNSLQESMVSARSDNQKIINGMEKSIEKRGNRAEDLKVMEQAEEVIGETDKIIQMITEMRAEMVKVSGGKDEDGHYVKADEEDEVMNVALGTMEGAKSGKAYELERLLNAYSERISDYDSVLQIPKLALGASEISRYKNEDGQKTKDFAELNFEETPMVAALAVLSDIQNKVSRVESKALGVLSEKVGAKDLVFDEIIAVVAPESRYVTAGTPYQARVYVAAHSTAANPSMSSNVGNIHVLEDGSGELKFTASASDFDKQGYAKRVWTGSVKLRTPKGDTILQIREEYTVVKPNIKISSASVQALYRNCGNDLDVQVPELGVNYNPVFNASGATVQTTGQKGLIKIIPTGSKVSLVVKNNGATIGIETFRVKKVPHPSLVLLGSGKKLDLARGGATPRRINVKAIPDEDFAEFLPKDARYRVTQIEVILARGTTAAKRQTFNSGKVELREFARDARKGDRLVIEVKKVERLNYLNQRETVRMEMPVFSYSITAI
jgi:gliding motility-associated protein GldM